MSQKFKSEVELQALNNAATDTDKFLVSDSGVVKYRTGAQILSDIGAQSALTNPVTGTGVANYVSKWTGTNTQGNSQIFDNGTSVGIGTTSPSNKLHINSTDNNTYALRVQGNTNNESGAWTGIGISGEEANTKSAILFQDNGSSYSRGNLIFAINNAVDQTSATPSDAVMTLLANGNVGIGTTTIQGKLHIRQTANLGGLVGNSLILQTLENSGGTSGNTVFIKDYAYRDAAGTDWSTWRHHNSIDIDGAYNTPGTNTRTFWERDPLSELHIFGSITRKVLTIDASSNQRVGINIDAPSYPLHVSGNVSNISIYATNDIVAFSDQSVKTNIRPIENALERVVKSRGVLYDRTDSENKDNIGFIAQELEVNFPELVVTNEDGTKAVKYQNTVAVLFEAIKEQQKKIEELKQIVNGFTK